VKRDNEGMKEKVGEKKREWRREGKIGKEGKRWRWGREREGEGDKGDIEGER
jgi:hypothetical protein